VTHLLRRAGSAILLVWLVCTITFGLLHLAPGDAALLLLPPEADAQALARLRTSLGLDAPLAVQYLRWVGSVATGDLGLSLASGRPVAALLADAIPVSAALGLASLALTVLAGLAIGSAQARRAGSATDTTITLLTTTAYAAPTFWLALAVVAAATTGVAALGLPPAWRLPAFGMRDPGVLSDDGALLDTVRHAILPVLVLATTGAAAVARYARAALVDAARSEARRTALAKGLAPRTAWRRHVERLAWPAIVTLVALSLPGIVGGSVFVEGVFAWPGMGKLLLTAVAQRDTPVILGATLAYATTVIAANLAADLALPRLDPRRRA
jgi:peptide/nickel transport system permease protein